MNSRSRPHDDCSNAVATSVARMHRRRRCRTSPLTFHHSVLAMMRAIALPLLGFAGVGAQEQVACDLSKANQPGGADAICADFCNYKCGFWNASSDLPTETGKPQNITLYRITPFNVSGIVNKNTGDAPGDVGFYLERKNITQQCAKDPHSFGCFLDGDNMYGQFTVEVRTRVKEASSLPWKSTCRSPLERLAVDLLCSVTKCRHCVGPQVDGSWGP